MLGERGAEEGQTVCGLEAGVAGGRVVGGGCARWAAVQLVDQGLSEQEVEEGKGGRR